MPKSLGDKISEKMDDLEKEVKKLREKDIDAKAVNLKSETKKQKKEQTSLQKLLESQGLGDKARNKRRFLKQ